MKQSISINLGTRTKPEIRTFYDGSRFLSKKTGRTYKLVFIDRYPQIFRELDNHHMSKNSDVAGWLYVTLASNTIELIQNKLFIKEKEE